MPWKPTDERPQRPQGPPLEFLEWWYPTETDPVSGASVGGHPDAERVWARKDPGRWMRRVYGCNANIAWEAQNYRQEYFRWVDAERPIHKPFVSIVATLQQQQMFWDALKSTLRQVGKKMPSLPPVERKGWDEEDEEEIPF